MKKKTKAATGPKCTSTANTFKCALTGDHEVHCSSEKRAGQYMTWTTLEDGRVQVQIHNGKNKGESWINDAPAAPRNEKLASVGYCGAKFESYARTEDSCLLEPGHAGPHENTSIGSKEIEVDPRPLPSDFPEEPEDGDESREVHARELEAEPKEPSLTDACPKCGKELGEHDGEKCPKPAKAKVSKIYTQAEREALEKQQQELEPPPAPLTKIGSYEVHPAAALFPMICDADYPTFRDDIKKNGQRKRIVRIGKLILDGRNRLRALLDLGIEPLFREFGSEPSDGADPIAFVVSENIHRRHLNETQRAFVGAELVPMYAAGAKERQRAAGGAKPLSANLREAGKAAGKAAEAAARAVNVSAKSVEAALRVKRDGAPEVLAAARDRGQIKVSTAANLSSLPKAKQKEIVDKVGGGELRSGKVRQLVSQEKKRAIVREINAQKVPPLPAGPFGVIYGDYPWHYDNSDQHEGSRGHLGYPTMTMDQVLAHAAEATTRAAENCIIALWSTNLYVTAMERVIAAYGATVRTVLTWPKSKFGVGTWARGQTEHLVIASIGEPTHTLNEISTLLKPWKPEHPGEHSSKPKEVAELLRKHCSGPFLELFGRGPREGFVVWGAEADKFATEAA